MKKKKRTELLAEKMGGLVDKYVELNAKVDGFRQRIDALDATLAALAHRVAELEGEDAPEDPERVMQEYCYGRRGDAHV